MNHEFDIAIVGMACRFPGAQSIPAFWQNLINGVESITRFSDQELLAAGVSPDFLSRPDYVKAAPVLDDPYLFDAAFFGFAPSEADSIDPQHRLLLELAHEALEDAACDPTRFPGRIGVFAGSALNTYFINRRLNTRLTEEYIPTLIGNDKDFLSTRLSYKLGLRGPSITVQTACSTSLVAIHLARQSLLNEETDVALAGAVSIRVPHRAGYFDDGGGVVSPDGHVRAFDAGANGTVFGSGAAVIALKRLDDALAQGDPIHAIIKGSAVNNDGAAKAGYTTPSVDGQADVIVEALSNAGVNPESISYVEAHGSGTPVGDPIELLALTKAFRNFTQRTAYCAIGSVKTNVGHLDAAAGMAGLIKTVLALKHRRLPPTLHYSKPNPEIDFPATPFYVVKEAVKWVANGTPRRAGVMSTGMGGTNAHLVLEEAPALSPIAPVEGPSLLLLSAKTPSALDSICRNLADFLAAPCSHASSTQSGPVCSECLADVAYTLQQGRTRYAFRRFMACTNTTDAVAALKTSSKPILSGSAPDGSRRPVVFLLPGMGDHYVGMGRGLYDNFKVFREEIDRCARILQPLINVDVRELLYPPLSDREESSKPRGIDLKRMLGHGTDQPLDPAARRLDQTIHNQPALFTLEYALARLWIHWGVEPDRMVGHSMGEYVTACLAGVFSLEDALKLVALRARLVNALPQGSMLAVMLPEDKLTPLLSDQLSISLINGPGLCVVAGPVVAMADFQNQLKQQEITFRPVRNAHGFHSRMLDPIVAPFAREVSQVRLTPPRIPFISNVTGTWITSDQACDPSYWADHAHRTARFSNALEQMWKIPDCLGIEVGPGRTLGVLAMQHPARTAAASPCVLSSLRHDYENQPDTEFILQTIGKLWLAGTEIDWDKLDARTNRSKVSLPTYPFERQRHFIELPTGHEPAELSQSLTAQKSDVADWFYVPSWDRTGFPIDSNAVAGLGALWLVLGEQSDLSKHIMATLQKRGASAVFACFGKSYGPLHENSYEFRADHVEDYANLLKTISLDSSKVLNVLHLGPLTTHVKPIEAGYDELSQELGFYSLLNLAKAIGEQDVRMPIRIGVVTCQIHDVTGEEKLNPAMATVLGPCGVIPKEYPNITSFSVDLQALPSGNPRVIETVLHLLGEFQNPARGGVVAYRGKYRWERSFKPKKLPAPKATSGEESIRAQGLRPRGVYLITGGTGGIGLAIARHLAQTCQARLILTKKTPFPEKSVWRQRLAAGDLPDADQRVLKTLLEIEALGGEVEIFVCEVSDQKAMRRVVAQSIAKHGTLNGVIHSAGIVRDGMIQMKTKEVATSVLDPKVRGTFLLFDILKDLDLDVFVLFSSISTVVPLHGQSDYCAANAFLDGFVAFANSKARFRTLTINWSGWREVGILTKLATPTGRESWKQIILKRAIETKDGLEAFMLALSSNDGQLIVSPRALGVVLEEERQMRLGALDGVLPLAELTNHHGGSIDRTRPDLKEGFIAPRTPMEQTLAGIWGNLLGLKGVGVNDDFFELGGHSLLAVGLFSKLEKLTGRRFPLATLFKARTISSLAELIENQKKSGVANCGELHCVVPIRTSGSGPPFFCIHGVGGNVLSLNEIAKHLAPDRPVYGVQSKGLSGMPPETSIAQMARSYIEEIRRVQPEGPYLLAGHSFGGWVAYEIGCQLEAEGQPAALIALIDTRINDMKGTNAPKAFVSDANLVYRRIKGHTRGLLLGPDRRGYLKARARTLRRKAIFLAFSLKLRLFHRSGESLPANIYNITQLNYLAAYNYVPKPSNVRVTLFRCEERGLGDHPDYLMGWSSLAMGGVRVVETPGNHVSMITEPHVLVLAQKLGDCLREASNKFEQRKNVDSKRMLSSPVASQLIESGVSD